MLNLTNENETSYGDTGSRDEFQTDPNYLQVLNMCSSKHILTLNISP